MGNNRFSVKLTPKASCNEIKGWIKDAEGHKILKVSVTAVPEKGKANKALIALLAKEYKVPKSSVWIIRGESERVKLIQIDSL